jgi:polyisoprenoid-binding protein YceI
MELIMNLTKNKKYSLISSALILFLTPTAYSNISKNSKENTTESNVNSIEKYTIDSSHSKVSFKVAHLVISSVTGEFKKFNGTFSFNPGDFSQTQLEASAETASIDTSTSDRDEHLKQSEYFDVKKFPFMTFKSTSVKKTGEKSFDLNGNITIKGITKSTTFKITYLGQVKSDDKIIQVFTGTTQIKRKDFGLNFQNVIEAGPVVGETVTIDISAEGVRKMNAKI